MLKFEISATVEATISYSQRHHLALLNSLFITFAQTPGRWLPHLGGIVPHLIFSLFNTKYIIWHIVLKGRYCTKTL